MIYNKITITQKVSKNSTIKNVFLMSDGCKDATPVEMANFLAGMMQKISKSEPKIKIKKKSYKRVPKKYMVI